MLPLPTQDAFFTARKQIKKLEYIFKKLDTNLEQQKITQVQKYYVKLIRFHYSIMKKGIASRLVQKWFEENPLYRIEREIRRHVLEVSRSRLISEYKGKDSFLEIIQDILQKLDKCYQVDSLISNNNPVLVVHRRGEQFVCRYFRVNSEEDIRNISARKAREILQGVSSIVQPYELIKIYDDRLETTFLELSEYFARGTLKNFFLKLHKDRSTGLDKLQNLALKYSAMLRDFYTQINAQRVWYTDLKLSNLLINDHDEIRISDAKALVLSSSNIVPVRRTSLTKEYYQTSAFKENNVNLMAIQCQNFACTLYEMLTGTLPAQNDRIALTASQEWHNTFDFSASVFKGTHGTLLRQMIETLHSSTYDNNLTLTDAWEDAFAGTGNFVHRT